MSMVIEGVTFVVSAIRAMSREEFLEKHADVFWLDRPREVRLKMLSDAYDLIMR